MILYDGIIDNWYYGNGISRYYRTLASGAARTGHDVELVGFCNTFQVSDDIKNLKVNIIKSRILERYRDFDANYDDVQIFHSSYYRLPSKCASLSIKKVVTTVHDFVYERFAHGPKKIIHSLQKKRAVLGSDVVICISESTRQDLYRFIPEFPKNKVFVVYNGVSSEFFPTNDSDFDFPSPYVLYVGGRHGYKNFSLAVNSISQTNGLCLAIVGGGPLTSEEKKLLDSIIPGRYRVLGRIEDSLLRSYYSGAHALLYPSSFEGFGIPIIEAMRCGCPVLALRSPAIEEVSGRAAVLVDYIDADLIAKQLKRLSDINMRSELREHGIVWAKKFSWDSCVDETLARYSI